ncbi:MAG: site-specific DNA-methyltransferase [Paracoccaceae bacterium]
MTELVFKGKEFVWNHHLAVPFRPLVPQPDKGIGDARLDGNLIVQGDNLHALKALLPMYAGNVDCIFIDPPYNTGNEGWAYNDNVNAPMIKEWLEANPIGIEDGLRHDKWCAMMLPRLRLLHELLSDEGSIWVTLDANEVHRAKLILDEVFGPGCALGTLVWEKSDSPRMDANTFSSSHDFILAYAKRPSDTIFQKLFDEDEEPASHYSLTTEDGRKYYLKPLRAMGSGEDTREARPSMFFPLIAPDGEEVLPKRPDGTDGRWRWGEGKVKEELARIEWRGSAGQWTPYFRIFADTTSGRPPETIWYHKDVGSSRGAKAEIKAIFGDSVFDTPKPLGILRRVLEIASERNSIVLDSFAGSGTTAHAVLEANKRDGGNRRFILVEMEGYADKLTAERVRRVVSGYDFEGTQKTELLRERLNWSKLRAADRLTEQVEKIENLHGHEFDRIKKEVKDGELVVTGEKTVAERAEGLGGSFTYCTLGEPVELDNILTGEDLPDFAALGGILFHMSTSQPMPQGQLNEARFHVGEVNGTRVWMIYRPDLDWLKSPDAALTLTFARSIAQEFPNDRHLVFAPARYVSQRLLDAEGLAVEFVPLPFALYRVERG